VFFETEIHLHPTSETRYSNVVMKSGGWVCGSARMLFLLFFLHAGCTSIRPCQDGWWGRDKAGHFAVGGLMGAGTALAGRDNEWNDAETGSATLGIVAVAGFGKELYDQEIKKTCWSWKDWTWNLAGAMAGWTLVSVGK
jgi:putative lipoprotein